MLGTIGRRSVVRVCGLLLLTGVFLLSPWVTLVTMAAAAERPAQNRAAPPVSPGQQQDELRARLQQLIRKAGQLEASGIAISAFANTSWPIAGDDPGKVRRQQLCQHVAGPRGTEWQRPGRRR
jgi:hypothetical protein